MRNGARPATYWRLSTLLLLFDVAGFVLAFNLSYRYAIAEWLGLLHVPFISVLLLQLMMLYVLGLYNMGEHSSRLVLLVRTGFATALSGLITAGVVYITESQDTEPFFFRGVLPGGFALFLIWASLARYAASVWSTRMSQGIRWLVMSDLQPCDSMFKDLDKIGSFGDMSILVKDPGNVEALPVELQGKVGGGFTQLQEQTARDWSGLIIATRDDLPEDVLREIMSLRLGGLRVYDLTEFYEQFLEKIPVMYLRDNWFVLSQGFDLLHHDVELKIKRVIDLLLAGLLLVLTAPLVLIAAVAIKLERRGQARGPVLYRQLRTGANGTDFNIYKLRTMVNDAERNGAQWASSDDNRVTRVGKMLRSWRLDELPQLWNVLKGEMSFVGPRPERPDFNEKLEKEIPYYDLRHLVKPGITGWAQVKYDYGASMEDALEKLQYDIYYIKNYSLLLDLLIVLRTLRVMLSRRGR